MAPLRELILAVDDNPVNIKMLYEMLNHDYNFISANDGSTAIEKASAHHPDLILLDVMMPGKNGFETCRELKSKPETANIPIIFLTARSDNESVIEGLQAGAVDYVCKPFRREELECRIRNHISLVKSQKDLSHELFRRNLAQKQLSEKTKLLSLVTDNINDAVLVCKPDGLIILASASCRRTFGIDSIDMIGKYIWQIAKVENENEIIKKTFAKVLSGETTNARFIFHNFNHLSFIVIEWHAAVVHDEPTGTTLVVIDANDITLKAKSVSRLRKNIRLQNSLRIITAELSHITKIRHSLAYLVESLMKIIQTDELILLLGRADAKTEYYYINCHTSHCKIGVIPDSKNDYTNLITMMKNSSDELISSIQASYIPSEIVKRNHRFIIYPIRNESQLVGAFYIGKNDKTSIQPDIIYSIVTIAGLIKNIINKNSFEQRIRSREQELRQLFESSANAIVIINSQLKIERHNNRFVEMFDLKQGYYSQHSIKNLLKDDIFTNIEQILSRTTDSNKYEVIEIPYTNAKHEKFFYEITCSLIKISNAVSVWMLIITDITKLKDIDRAIFSTITSTEEHERTRLARELHDGIGALLSSINIYINLILSGEMQKDEMLNTLALTKGLIDEAIQSTKEVANNLHPVILTRFGLVETIKSFIEKIDTAGIVKIKFNYSDFQKLENKNLELTIYRIIHELINNTLKYAKASDIAIELKTLPTTIQLDYADNGIGMDLDSMNLKKSGMGLSNIEGRIKALNGICKFHTKPQKGFRVFIEIPYIATKNNITNNSDNGQN